MATKNNSNMTIRLPDELHEQVQRAAQARGVSLNAYVNLVLGIAVKVNREVPPDDFRESGKPGVDTQTK